VNERSVTLVVARAANGVIGRDGGLPWHISADLKRFKRLTMGSVMIMGRRTFDSLPGVLPGRRHIVLTRDSAWQAPGVEVVQSVAYLGASVRPTDHFQGFSCRGGDGALVGGGSNV
jgi:dihydrofolate reductase